MTSARAARRNPLQLYITTAGHDKKSLCWELWKKALAVQKGESDETHGGSWHIALASTKQSPKDDPQRWRLTVKRGINGKDGPEGPVGPPGRPGVDLTPAGLMQSGPLEP